MRLQKTLPLAALLITISLFFFSAKPTSKLISQNTNNYMGPTEAIPGNPQLVRAQVIIHDSPLQGGVQIKKVAFHGKDIPLKPRDIYGFRGQASFQIAPGRYRLTWTVSRDSFIWPRTVSHEEIINISPRDLWVQISVNGEEASID